MTSIPAWLPPLMFVTGYLLGSVPFGLLASKCLGAVDPRTAGSRNIGFTNVLRVSGQKAGVLTLAGDLGKGWIVAWLAGHVMEQPVWVLAVALSPVLGHLYSVFLGFHGGKGVATGFGAVLGVAPGLGLVMIATWLMAAGIWRYSSGAAITAYGLLPLLGALWVRNLPFMTFTIALSGLVLVRHHDNMRRLWQGTEPKMGQRREPM